MEDAPLWAILLSTAISAGLGAFLTMVGQWRSDRSRERWDKARRLAELEHEDRKEAKQALLEMLDKVQAVKIAKARFEKLAGRRVAVYEVLDPGSPEQVRFESELAKLALTANRWDVMERLSMADYDENLLDALEKAILRARNDLNEQ